MNKLRIIFKYLNYYINAKSKYKIHSPFVYDLLINVINYYHYENDFDFIEGLRENLLQDDTYIEVNDLGAKGDKQLTIDNGELTIKNKRIRDIAKDSSKSLKYSQLLYRIVKHFEPKTLVELGTSFGISTMYQALAADKSRMITVEGNESSADVARQNFKKLGLRNVELIVDNFDNALPEILNKLDRLDYAFIDGNHRKKPTINYFEQCLAKSDHDTILIFDDIHWSEGMEEAWKYIQEHKKVVITIDLFFMGLVFFPKNIVKQNHRIRY